MSTRIREGLSFITTAIGNNTTSIIMVEFGTNTSMNHAGGSTVAKLAVGDTLGLRVAAGTITFDGYRSWVNLQIVNDPGKSYALFGAIIALLGLLLSLFTRQRRIWIKVEGRVQIAGLAKNGVPGLDDELASLKKALEEK